MLKLFFSLLLLIGSISMAHPFGIGAGMMSPNSDFMRLVLNPTAIRQFNDICMNATLTKADIIGQLQSWAQTNGVSQQYSNSTARLQQRQQQLQQLAQANLAGQALQLFNQINSVLTNNAITRVAECDAIRAAGNSTNGTQAEVRNLVPVPPSAIPCSMYPRECYLVPVFGRGRDEPGVVEVNFVHVPENIQAAGIPQMGGGGGEEVAGPN